MWLQVLKWLMRRFDTLSSVKVQSRLLRTITHYSVTIGTWARDRVSLKGKAVRIVATVVAQTLGITKTWLWMTPSIWFRSQGTSLLTRASSNSRRGRIAPHQGPGHLGFTSVHLDPKLIQLVSSLVVHLRSHSNSSWAVSERKGN